MNAAVRKYPFMPKIVGWARRIIVTSRIRNALSPHDKDEGFTDGPVNPTHYTRGAVDDESGNSEHNRSYDDGCDDLPPG